MCKCHRSIFPLALRLYRSILALDVEAIERKYADLDKRAERTRVMSIPGIAAAGATS